jgi:hypothetical protein
LKLLHPPELADAGVVVLDELLVDVLPGVLRLLPAERAPPAGLADDLLDELQVSEVELLGGEVARGDGEGGHGGRLEFVFRWKEVRFYKSLAKSVDSGWPIERGYLSWYPAECSLLEMVKF